MHGIRSARVLATILTAALCLLAAAWNGAAAAAVHTSDPAGDPEAGPGHGVSSPAFGISPLLDWTDNIYGAAASLQAATGTGQSVALEAGAGYSVPHKRISWRAGLRLDAFPGPSDRWSLLWRRWDGTAVLGRDGEEGWALAWHREQGLEQQVDWEFFRGRLDARLGETAPSEAAYLHLRLADGWVVGPVHVGVRLESLAGAVLPAGGEFYSSLLTLPVELQGLRVQPWLGFSQAGQSLAGYAFSVGGAGSLPPLRGYEPGSLRGDRVVALSVEYRRPLPWLSDSGLPILSWLEGALFADAAGVLTPGETVRQLKLHGGYGGGLILSVGPVTARGDLAWNEQGGFHPEAYLQASF